MAPAIRVPEFVPVNQRHAKYPAARAPMCYPQPQNPRRSEPIMDRVPAPGEPAQLFVDGAFRTAERAEPVIEAGTGEPLGSGCAANESEVDGAVAAARAALPGWREVPLAERAAVLIRFADALQSRANGTRELCSRENGMPLALSRGANGAFPAALLRYYAALIVETGVEETRPSMIGHTIVRREPVGVVAAVIPWNYPQALAAMKFAPALAAGCTVVLKAAPETALDALVFGDAATEAGLPPGVLNVLAGGPDAGAHLVSHPGIDKVAFTGSTAAGRKIAEVCGRLMRPVTLELGRGSRRRSCSTMPTWTRRSVGCATRRSSTTGKPATSIRVCWPRARATTRWSTRSPRWPTACGWVTHWTRRPRSGRWSAPGSGNG